MVFKVIDVVVYDGEPIVETRLQYLNCVVDEFVIIEGTHTLSGGVKTRLHFEKNKHVFEPYLHKVKLHEVTFPDDLPIPPPAPGIHADCGMWCARENYLFDSVVPYLLEQEQPFFAFVGDVDAIPRKEALANLEYLELKAPLHFEMAMYHYSTIDSKSFVIPSFVVTPSTSLYTIRVSPPRWHMPYAGFHFCFLRNNQKLKVKNPVKISDGEDVYIPDDLLELLEHGLA
jgi:hypothetical protein